MSAFVACLVYLTSWIFASRPRYFSSFWIFNPSLGFHFLPLYYRLNWKDLPDFVAECGIFNILGIRIANPLISGLQFFFSVHLGVLDSRKTRHKCMLTRNERVPKKGRKQILGLRPTKIKIVSKYTGVKWRSCYFSGLFFYGRECFDWENMKNCNSLLQKLSEAFPWGKTRHKNLPRPSKIFFTQIFLFFLEKLLNQKEQDVGYVLLVWGMVCKTAETPPLQGPAGEKCPCPRILRKKLKLKNSNGWQLAIFLSNMSNQNIPPSRLYRDKKELFF